MLTYSLRLGSSIISFSFLIATSPVHGAPPEDCQYYANNAIDQYHRAKALGIPNLSHPVWSYNYSHHYDWCIKTTDAVVNNGRHHRENVIKDFCIKTHGHYGPPLGPRGTQMENVPSQCLPAQRTGTPSFQMKAPSPPTSGPTQHQIRPR